ncbi:MULTISPECIES: Flp pilus assembly protein CpaB [unclassified Pseudomonas]|uniref:Flp pilus assembly protein CpaB n=1 Tax=unclassified Pseudomonas TaxID=196821 RepID=UPI0021601DFC|nr:Flp pilus assembly protein CpaB [Pseudomonas sp. B21-015]UVM49795.1 Flp pilus assembly protein CpaB [Pseudomonas sp. B21-015]
MNSRVTMGLAGLFLVGAIIAGYWGLALSRQQPPESVAQPGASSAPLLASMDDPTRQPVVVLLRDIAPFEQITAADVALEKLRTAPVGSLTRLDQAVGRTPWRALTAGSWLNDESFEAGGVLARMIRADERALAVAADDVINVGGQLSPGDYVDVLLFLRMDTNNVQQSAQVVVPALRVLGVGDQLGLMNDGQPANPARSHEEKLKQEQLRASARTVLLAVPEPLLSRLMLAAQVGVLRLAVRSAEEKRLSHYWAGHRDSQASLANANRELVQFSQLALAGTPKSPAPGGAPRKPGVEVIRGNEVTQQTP